MGIINKDCYRSNVEPDERNPPAGKDSEASRLHARRHDTTGNLQPVESARERRRRKCHTVHLIKITFTEIRSQTTCLCMSTKTIDIKLLYHFEYFTFRFQIPSLTESSRTYLLKIRHHFHSIVGSPALKSGSLVVGIKICLPKTTKRYVAQKYFLPYLETGRCRRVHHEVQSVSDVILFQLLLVREDRC